MFVFTCLLVLAATGKGGARVPRTLSDIPGDGTMEIVDGVEEFNCTGRLYGLYPDTVSGCRMVHVCLPALSRLFSRSISFYCKDDTVFDQKTQSCVRAEIGLPCFKAPVFTKLSTRLSNMIDTFVGPLKSAMDPLNIFGPKVNLEDQTHGDEILKLNGVVPVRFSRIPTNFDFLNLKPIIRPVFTIPISTGTKLGNFIKNLKPSKPSESTSAPPVVAEEEPTTTEDPASRQKFDIDIRLGTLTDLPEKDEFSTTPFSAFNNKEDGEIVTEVSMMVFEEVATTLAPDAVLEELSTEAFVEEVPATTERAFRYGARMAKKKAVVDEQMAVTDDEMPESTTVAV